MNLRMFLTIIAALAVVHGIAFVLAPDFVDAIYGLSLSPAVALMSRLFGGALLAWGGILWSARDFREEAALRAVLICTAVPEVIGLITVAAATLSGTLNAMGWLATVIYLFGACGCAYFLVTSPKVSAA